METEKVHPHKSSEEITALAFQICRLLDGVPLGQAMVLVKNEVPSLLADGHLVDTSNPRFVTLDECAKYSAYLSRRVRATS